MLLCDLPSSEDASAVAHDLLTQLREPFLIEGLTLEVDASIGIACAPEHGTAVEQLIQRADIAMYAAKEGGRGHLLFEQQLDRYSPRRLSLAGALRSAIADGEIVLFYQPKAELTTGKIVGVEALARWQHPRLGLIGPSEFVPIAEQTGLIGPLTSHVLQEALSQLSEWAEQGEELSVAVNLSARSFLDAQLAVEIPRLLEASGVDARRLELEITESMLMLDPARAKATLDRLSAIGLSLSVDDFGTGYSSLANLKRLPVDVIKIDKSFVIDMPHDPSDAAIVRSTIDLAHNLGLKRRGRGRRVARGVAPPGRAGLRPRAGLLRVAPAARGRDDPSARRAAHGPRGAGVRCPNPSSRSGSSAATRPRAPTKTPAGRSGRRARRTGRARGAS